MKPEDQPDLRLVPAAGLAWLMTWWGLTSGRPPVLWAISGLLVGCLLTLRHRVWAGALAMLLPALCLAAAMVRAEAVHATPVAEAGRQGAVVIALVRLDSDVRVVGQSGRERAVVAATAIEWESRGRRWRTRQLVEISAGGALRETLTTHPAGSTLRVMGIAAAPDAGQKEAAVLRLRASPESVAPPPWWMRQVNRVRAGLVASMGWATPEQAGLVPSLVVGDTSGLASETKEQFRTTGLTHLTAVSGTNLTLLLATMLVVARTARVRGRALHVVATCGVVVFVVVCRAEPSVVRAAAMGLVGLAAVGAAADRRRGLRHLCTAMVVLLLVDPWLARSWGFALSVGASAGILWWGPPWRARLATWMPGWLAESLAIPLAAQLATQPLVTALSGSISTTGLLANVLAGPFVGPTTVIGLVGAGLAMVHPALSLPVGWIAGWCIQPVLLIAAAGAGMPAAAWAWPPGAWPLVVLAAGCLLAGLLAGWVLARRWACGVLAIVVVAAMVRQPPPQGWPGDWAVVFCAVGQGDATVLNAGRGRAVVVDTGPDPAPLRSCLQSLGVSRVPLLVLTHFHADHVDGLPAVTGMTDRMMLNPHTEPVGTHRSVLTTAARSRVRMQAAVPGSTWQVGEVRLEVVHAGAVTGSRDGMGESSTENDSSIVLRATVRGLRVLLPADTEPAAHSAILSTGAPLSSHALKMPHHGSSRQDEQFWRATGAAVAVASAGERNSHGHPSGKALALASRLGMRVLRTDGGESFALWLHGGRVHVRAARLG